MPHGITQCYLPPGRADIPAFTPAEAGTLVSVHVVKLLSKTWWIPTGARLEGPKLEPTGPRAEVGLPTADQM